MSQLNRSKKPWLDSPSDHDIDQGKATQIRCQSEEVHRADTESKKAQQPPLPSKGGKVRITWPRVFRRRPHEESKPCTDRSSLDRALKTGCTKPLPSLSAGVLPEYDSTGEDVKANSLRIKDPTILAPCRETSSTSSGSPRHSSLISMLEVLLSDLQLGETKPELPVTNPEGITEEIPPPEASSELKPHVFPGTPLATYKEPSGLSTDTPIGPITDRATSRTQRFQTPSPLAQRTPSMSDDAFLFDSDMNMSTFPGSLVADREETAFTFGSLMSIEESSYMTSYPQAFNTLHQDTRVDVQQAPFQFTNFAPSNAMPVNNRTSLLSQHLKGHGYVPTYGNPVEASPVINQSSFLHSAGQVAHSPIHYFTSPSLGTNEKDQYMLQKFDEDLDLQLLSPGPGFSPPTVDWPFDQNKVDSKPTGIESLTNKVHGRGVGLSNSFLPRRHPYYSHSYGGGAEAVYSPGSSFDDHIAKQFAPHQQQAALKIMNYKQAHPNTAIPVSLITADLAEVLEGRGWCLLGNCGVDRAKQRLDPHYDPAKDTARKRLDHLYDHIRDKHFNCRPFRCSLNLCTQTFSREHDLKRHEKIHTAVSLPCNVCGKHYTRDDNLKRHAQLKHFSLPQMSRGTSSCPF